MLQIPNNNFNAGNFPKSYIIIHGTAGGTSAIGIATYFKGTEGGNNPVSSHYIVGQDGVVVQCVQEQDGAWANGSPLWNNQGISIEHVKSATDNSSILTSAQQISSFSLIKDICDRHSIPRANILPHSAVFNTACPGPYPWDFLTSYLKGVKEVATTPTAAQQTALTKRWNSVYQNVPAGTGIFKAWSLDYINGVYHGPPMSLEYASVDWNGKPIIVQEFMYGWCEWVNFTAIWYK